MYLPNWLITGTEKLGLKSLEAWLSKSKRQEQEIQKLQRELQGATQKISEYESFENLKSEFTHSQEEGVYWRKDGSGPYCSVCMDIDHCAVHLIPHGSGFYLCGKHKELSCDLRKRHHMPRPVYRIRRSRNR